MGDVRNSYRILVRKPEGVASTWVISVHRWNAEMKLKEIG
jgi:hypothetical protein